MQSLKFRHLLVAWKLTFGADSSEEEKEEPEINVDNVFKNIEE